MDGQFGFLPQAKIEKISHIIFADDILLFFKGDSHSINLLLDAVNEFSEASGLKTNPSKCNIFFSSVPIAVIRNVISRSRFSWGELPIKFLGLPLLTSRLNAVTCQPLINNLCSRVLHWTNRFLSQAGRLHLIRSVLFAVQSFWAMYLFLPKGVLKKIEGILFNFLWGGGNSRSVHKVARSVCCTHVRRRFKPKKSA